MDRRTALKTGLIAAGGLVLPEVTFYSNECFGWDFNPRSIAAYVERTYEPFVTQVNAAIKDSGRGKKAFLHTAIGQTSGRPYKPHAQGASDCVSHAAGLGVDIVNAVQIAVKGMAYRWVHEVATEPIHWGSRNEIGQGQANGPGSRGHWAADWLTQYGTILRQKYPGGHDFTKYSAETAKKYEDTGCPDELEPVCKQHPIKKMALCESYSDLCDCIYNGSPVMVCSSTGFGEPPCKRDAEGFLRRRRWRWHHAMLFSGYDDEYKRPGALCLNSWDAWWVEGPTRGQQPEGSFWVDADVVDDMLEQGDSFAMSAYVGFPRVDIPKYILW